MADEIGTKEDGFIKLSSEESAERNEHVVVADPDPSAAQSLTGHTNEPEVVKDEAGRTIAAHQTRVITDPNSPEAVQVPDPEVYPQANATLADPLAALGEPSPAEVFAGTREPNEADEAAVPQRSSEFAKPGDSKPADE